MIDLLFAAAIKVVPYEEQVNRQCSYIVGIPYASDDFTDDEWNRFKLCKKLIMRED
jgi:hypothetical protein